MKRRVDLILQLLNRNENKMEEQYIDMITASSESYTSVQNKSKECDKEDFLKRPLDKAIDGSPSMDPKILPQVETEQRILKGVNSTSKISGGYNVASTIEEQASQNIRDRSNSTSSSTSSSSSSSISSSSSKSSSSMEKNGGEMNNNSSPLTIPGTPTDCPNIIYAKPLISKRRSNKDKLPSITYAF